MKTAVYIEEGMMQLVLTPDNQWEKDVIAAFSEKPTEVQFFKGRFYACQGGWTRHRDIYEGGYGSKNPPESLILKAKAGA